MRALNHLDCISHRGRCLLALSTRSLARPPMFPGQAHRLFGINIVRCRAASGSSGATSPSTVEPLEPPAADLSIRHIPSARRRQITTPATACCSCTEVGRGLSGAVSSSLSELLLVLFSFASSFSTTVSRQTSATLTCPPLPQPPASPRVLLS